jgi:hypothetical protein
MVLEDCHDEGNPENVRVCPCWKQHPIQQGPSAKGVRPQVGIMDGLVKNPFFKQEVRREQQRL